MNLKKRLELESLVIFSHPHKEKNLFVRAIKCLLDSIIESNKHFIILQFTFIILQFSMADYYLQNFVQVNHF